MSDDELNALRQRVLRLEQIEHARGYLHTYAETMDDRDPETACRLFREDAVLTTVRGVARGRAEIRQFYRETLTPDQSGSRHFVAAPRATWLADGLIRLESYFQFVGRGDDASVIGWGTYDDTVDVSGERPCFAAKTITLHLRTSVEQGWANDKESA